MKNIKKMMSHFLVLGLLAGCGAFAASLNTHSVAPVKTPTREVRRDGAKQYTAADFAGEVEVNPEELSVSISQSTLTETSQSLNVIFRSKTVVGFRTAKNNYVVEIDDENFTGDVSNPAVDGYDRFDEESNLPIFNGVLSFVTGGSGNNRDVYLPETMTREGSFIIEITKITKDCVTADGAEYHNKNRWVDGEGENATNRINNIYIPKGITEVEAGAFTGVPATGVTIHVEGSSIPAGYASGWTDAAEENIDVSNSSYKLAVNKKANVGGQVTDLTDELNRPINFILGCQNDDTHKGAEYDRPLVMQYDRVKYENGQEVSRTTVFDTLEITNTAGNPYDSCGKISSLSYSRLFGYALEEGETIDDHSIIFHNIMKASSTSVIDTSVTYSAKPVIGYGEKISLDKLVSFKGSMNSTFAGYSMFSLTMDKNLSITSAKYPEPHSLYQDVKQDMYEQNLTKINEGKTKIRYSLYNLYNSAYHFQYVGKDGSLKDVVIPITTKISYQTLDSDKGNKVSILLKDSDIAPDFSADRVRLFELKDITIQMDLLTTSDSGSVSKLGKSEISYKFAYITVFNSEKKITVFNWNLFLILFFVGYVVVYAAAAFGTYKFMKEKFKNDEFRRVNDKKFLKSALLGGGGLGIVLAALLFIIMRTGGFKNTIVVFNPTDPLLIGFSIVAMIITGYFIVYVVKLIKAEKERRKAIRLKLAEDVDEDGTN